MPKPIPLLAAAALVAIPSSAGIYHLATSSSSKTVEQTEPNKEDRAQGPEETIEQIKEEQETIPAIEEEVGNIEDDSELPEETELVGEDIDIETHIKQSFLRMRSEFSYSFIDDYKGTRTWQLEGFVSNNDYLRKSFDNLITGFLSREEHKNKDIKTLAKDVLGLTLIDEKDETSWSKLVQIRKDEAETQTDVDRTVSRTLINPLGNGVTKESIKSFCQTPTEANSNLGWYASTRVEEEKTKEYRLFNYYSYCTNESHYLDSRLNFDPIQE